MIVEHPKISDTATFAIDVFTETARKKMITKKHYNRSAKELDQLNIGSLVLLQDFTSQKRKWQEGRVVEQLSDRSYLASNNTIDKAVRRNRSDLRQMVQGHNAAEKMPEGHNASGQKARDQMPRSKSRW